MQPVPIGYRDYVHRSEYRTSATYDKMREGFYFLTIENQSTVQNDM